MDMSEQYELSDRIWNNKRNVPEELLPSVLALLEKANRRADKIGVERFSIERGEPYERRIDHDAEGKLLAIPYYRTYYPITVNGPAVKVAGFQFLGRVDFEDGLTIVNAMPGQEIPKQFRQATMACWHCRAERKRSAVFIFRHIETGKLMQVGRSCLQDFMGVDPAKVLQAMQEWVRLCGELDDDEEQFGRGGERQANKVTVLNALELAAVATRVCGFMSRKKANETPCGAMTTAEVMRDYLWSRDGRQEFAKARSEADQAKAAAVLSWVRETWGAKRAGDMSDFEHNVVALVGDDDGDMVNVKRFGLLAPLVMIHDRALSELKARASVPNEWIGAAKDRRTFDAEYKGYSAFPSDFGTYYVGRFATAEGLVVYKGGSPFWDVHMMPGERIKFLATIKEHSLYQGTRQTVVSRGVAMTDAEFEAANEKARKAALRKAKREAKA